MSGFDAVKATELFNLADDFQPISITAFGYYGNPELLPDDMKKSEFEERKRKPLEELVLVKK